MGGVYFGSEGDHFWGCCLFDVVPFCFEHAPTILFRSIIFVVVDLNLSVKKITGKNHINWNFDGKFIIDRSGKVYVPNDEDEVESMIESLLDSNEL